MRKVVIVSGGFSAEKDISIKSAKTVKRELKKVGFETDLLIIKNLKDDVQILKNNDYCCAFIAIHGSPAEDGIIQKYLDQIKLAYTCCDSEVSSLTFDKFKCNSKLLDLGFNCPKSFVIKKSHKELDINNLENYFDYPFVIKPNSSGSSFGVSIVKRKSEISNACSLALRFSKSIIFEEFIEGVEVSCGVYYDKDIKVLPVTEIDFKNDFFDYKAKYEGESKEITPARINKLSYDKVQLITKKVYRKLKLKGICRIDFIIKDDIPYLIEVNTIPGLSNESIIPKQIKSMNKKLSEIFKISIENAIFNKINLAKKIDEKIK